jgi:hypothetical protein
LFDERSLPSFCLPLLLIERTSKSAKPCKCARPEFALLIAYFLFTTNICARSAVGYKHAFLLQPPSSYRSLQLGRLIHHFMAFQVIVFGQLAFVVSNGPGQLNVDELGTAYSRFLWPRPTQNKLPKTLPCKNSNSQCCLSTRIKMQIS